MHITEILKPGKTAISFEFFPPRSAVAWEELYGVIRELEPLRPSFVSVTYGAGGGTRELTHDLAVRIRQTTSVPPVPHLTCVGHTRGEIERILVRYAAVGIENVLALRGDPPKGQEGSYDWGGGEFPYASDLVRFIREFNESGRHPNGRGFGIGVAGFPEGHPGTPNRLLEMDFLKAKVDEGADYICTQLFFENADFFDFRDRCELAGIGVPIVAGIMPVTNASGLRRMAELAAGARFPAKLLKGVERAGGDAEAMERIGIHYAAQQCTELLNEGVAGLHFYTLNKSRATREICAALGVL